MIRLACAVIIAVIPSLAAAWDPAFVDPGSASAGPADLLLPMPCGGQMAFQRVHVPMEASDPLADTRLRLGQPDEDMAFSEYLRPAWLRGSFESENGDSTYYFIARYEMNLAQMQALEGDCNEPERRDRVAAGGLDWFRATELSRSYTEWLYANARETLPRQDGAFSFLRLPTETEWEYAARGGAKVDPSLFSAHRFFGEGALNDVSVYFAPGSSSGKLAPVGTRNPNPLGLFDVYGNAEELMLEPFRLNVLGREHGQPGGTVTRGGSALSTEAQVYSAQRSEFPPFDPQTGKPVSRATFGLRLVLSVPVTTSDAEVTALRQRWQELAAGDVRGGAPVDQLDAMIAAETDPRRLAALEELKADLRNSQEAVSSALRQSARSTLIAGAIFVGSLREGEKVIADRKFNLAFIQEQSKVSVDLRAKEQADRLILSLRQQLSDLRRSQGSYLLSYGSTLQTLTTDIPEEEGRKAFAQLRSELELAGETVLIALLFDYWRDLANYRTRPDAEPSALTNLALN